MLYLIRYKVPLSAGIRHMHNSHSDEEDRHVDNDGHCQLFSLGMISKSAINGFSEIMFIVDKHLW